MRYKKYETQYLDRIIGTPKHRDNVIGTPDTTTKSRQKRWSALSRPRNRRPPTPRHRLQPFLTPIDMHEKPRGALFRPRHRQPRTPGHRLQLFLTCRHEYLQSANFLRDRLEPFLTPRHDKRRSALPLDPVIGDPEHLQTVVDRFSYLLDTKNFGAHFLDPVIGDPRDPGTVRRGHGKLQCSPSLQVKAK